MSALPPQAQRPGTRHKTTRRANLLSLSEGIAVRSSGSASGAGGGLGALPHTGLPPRPSTRDASGGTNPLRRGAAALGSASAASPASPTLPRVSTAGNATRPPLWGASSSANDVSDSAGPSAWRAGGPSSDATATASRPGTQSRGRRGATPSTPASQMKRPSSQQFGRSGGRAGTSGGHTRSFSHGGGGSGAQSNQEFHRGLVSALQDVLRQQRQGVFPAPAGFGDGIGSTRPSRPGTRTGQEDSPATPLAGFAGLGGFAASSEFTVTDEPFDGAEPPAMAASAPDIRPPSQQRGGDAGMPASSQGRRPGAAAGRWRRRPDGAHDYARPPPGVAAGDADDVLLSAAAIQMLRNVERSEGIERATLVAVAESAWEALLNDETAQAVRIGTAAAVGSTPSSRRPSAHRGGRQHASRVPSAAAARPPAPTLSRTGSGAALRHGRSTAANSSANTSLGDGTASTGRSTPIDASTAAGPNDPATLKEQGNEHYAKRRFLAAHRSYSAAIELDPSNPVLFTNRAAVNTMLFNYDASVRDCLRATTIDPRAWKAYARMARAYALLGQYPVAARHYTTALLLLEDGAAPFGGEAALANVKTERGELQHLERGRLEAEAGDHQAAAGHYKLATTFADEPPVRLLRAASQMHFNPSAARAELTKYLGSQENPAAYATGNLAEGAGASDGGSLGSVASAVPALLQSRVTHYCQTLLHVAKASLFCGVHYLNIAAAHLQQCLAIKPEFPGAAAMLAQLGTFEDRLAAATDSAEAGKHAEAVVAFTEALEAVHESNAKVRLLVLHQRAESYLQLGSAAPALEDCSAALVIDGNHVKALTKRSRAYEALGDFRNALLDLEHASLQNEELAGELVALKMRMARAGFDASASTSSYYFGGASSSSKRPSTGAGGQRGGADGSQYQQQRPGTGARPGTSQQAAREPSHYEVLGVAPDADIATIRSAYRRLTLQLHPDKVVKAAEDVRRQCETRFKQVSHAYSVLSDAQQRYEYDLGRR